MGRIVGLIVTPPAVFVCPVCGKEYKTEDGLRKHVEKEHAENDPPQNGEQ